MKLAPLSESEVCNQVCHRYLEALDGAVVVAGRHSHGFAFVKTNVSAFMLLLLFLQQIACSKSSPTAEWLTRLGAGAWCLWLPGISLGVPAGRPILCE